MRNLQKILALVLALIMSFSLVATAGAFSDDGDISGGYNDAVKVLNGLDVFKGYSDGSFQPKSSITRAEVAAIIYRIATGDVTDAQASIYSTYGQFTDVADGSWYSGYVNYCANAGYIKGRGNKIFDPQATVTGYEALAMILRAVGYDKNGEFTGSNWQIRTASIANERDITKNVSSALLGQPATREMVAEILFRSIIIPKVNFNANTLSYTEKPLNSDGKKDTLGYESLKLEAITGVVTANEYADLENTTTLNSGKTRMFVDGVDGGSYVLDYAEENSIDGFDAIGEEHTAYIQNANTTSAKVLVMEKTDNNVTKEFLEKVEIDTDSKFRKETNLQRGSDTESFLNFGEHADWTSDYRLRWEVKAVSRWRVTADTEENEKKTAEENALRYWSLYDSSSRKAVASVSAVNSVKEDYTWANGTTEKVWKVTVTFGNTIAPNTAISTFDQAWMKHVFDTADREETGRDNYSFGEVYVGTSSLKDISDEISWKEFKSQYITTEETDIKANENGNWLKVIDNDKDGQADYVLKIVYTFAQVVKSADDAYALDVEGDALDAACAVNVLDDEDVVSDETLAIDDIVYYALIDGKAQTYKADVVSGVKIDTVNRNDLTATTTDGTTYTQSGVEKHIESRDYNSGVRNMSGAATYDLYLDRGGYLGVFTQPQSEFTLIVDGWFNSTKTGDEYAVKYYDTDAKKIAQTDVTRGGSMFISGEVDGVLNNDWNALKFLGGVDEDDGACDNTPNAALNGKADWLKTTVAALNSDGVLTPVDFLSSTRTIRMIDTNKQIPTSSAVKGDVYSTNGNHYGDTAYNTPGKTGVEVRALSTTDYYIVYKSNLRSADYSVRHYVGYGDAPKPDAKYIEDVYVVATLANRESALGSIEYYTADVVVLEMTSDYTEKLEQVFVYDLPVVTNAVRYERIDMIMGDGTTASRMVDLERSEIRNYRPAGIKENVGLYYLYDTTETYNGEDVYVLHKMSDADIAANNYVVGFSRTSQDTLKHNYVEVLASDSSNNIYGVKSVDIKNDNLYTYSYNNDNNDAELTQYKSGLNKYSFLGERADELSIDKAPSMADMWLYTHRPYDGHTTCAVAPAYWNNNLLLVRYDGDDIVYSISFEQIDGHKQDGAPSVWASNRPASSVWSGSADKTIDFARFVKDNYNSIYALQSSYTDTVKNALNALNKLLTEGKLGDKEADVKALVADLEKLPSTPDVPGPDDNNNTVTVTFDYNDAQVTVTSQTNITDKKASVAKNGSITFTVETKDGWKDATVSSDKGTPVEDETQKGTWTLSGIADDVKITISATEDPQNPSSLASVNSANSFTWEGDGKTYSSKVTVADSDCTYTESTKTLVIAKASAKMLAEDKSELPADKYKTQPAVSKMCADDGKYDWKDAANNGSFTIEGIEPATDGTFKLLAVVTYELKPADEGSQGVGDDENNGDDDNNGGEDEDGVTDDKDVDDKDVDDILGALGGGQRRARAVPDEKVSLKYFIIKKNYTFKSIGTVADAEVDETRSQDVTENTAVMNILKDRYGVELAEGQSVYMVVFWTVHPFSLTDGVKGSVSIITSKTTPEQTEDAKYAEAAKLADDALAADPPVLENLQAAKAALEAIDKSKLSDENKAELPEKITAVKAAITELTGEITVKVTVNYPADAEIDGTVQTEFENTGDKDAETIDVDVTVAGGYYLETSDTVVETETGYTVTVTVADGTEITVDAVAEKDIELTIKVPNDQEEVTLFGETTKFPFQIQKEIETSDADENGNIEVTGQLLYVSDGSADQKGYYIALQLSCEDATAIQENVKKNGMKPGGGWTDIPGGLLIHKITYDENNDNEIIPVEIKVIGDKKEKPFTIDLSGLDIGDQTKVLKVEPITGVIETGTVQINSQDAKGTDLATIGEPVTEGNTIYLTGTSKYINAESWLGFNTTSSHNYVALKLSYEGADAADIQFQSVDAPQGTAPWKPLGADGILIWQLTENSDGVRKNLTVKVQERIFTVNLEGVTKEKLDTKGLAIKAITAVGENEEILGKKGFEVQTGVTVTPKDGSASGTEWVADGTLKYVNYPLWSGVADETYGYYINLRLDVVGVDDWNHVGINRTGTDSGWKALPEAESYDEGDTDYDVISVKVDPTDIKPIYVKLTTAESGITNVSALADTPNEAIFSIDLSNLKFEDDVVVEKKTGTLGGSWTSYDASDLGNLEVSRVAGTDKFKVTGEVYHINPMTAMGSYNNGYFLNLYFNAPNGASDAIKMGTTGPTAAGFNNDDTVFQLKTSGNKRNQKAEDVTFEAEGKTFTLDLSELKLIDLPVLKETTQTTLFSGQSYSKNVSDLQKPGSVTVEISDYAKREVTVSGTLEEVAGEGWSAYGNGENKGWYIVLDWETKGGQFTFSAMHDIELNKPTSTESGTHVHLVAMRDANGIREENDTYIVGTDGQEWHIIWDITFNEAAAEEDAG